jgi:serine/threonine protein kinase
MPRPGDLLVGKYRLERVLGQGGMGIVYAAMHELLGQRVAVKLLVGATGGDAAARFLNEARAAARIQHENIARVMDVGTLPDGTPYMVLELLEGCDLERVLSREGRLPVATAVDHVLQALEAVAQAHALGIIHRDLKPANLFLTRRLDGSPQIKVLDFGVSKSDDMRSAAKTSAQAILGSPYYMSPEQMKSSRSVDRRADIWSVGVILFELLTAKYPFDGENVGELFAAILEATPTSPATYRPDCPPGLAAVILRCLTRDPALRYDGAPALAEALIPFASPRGVASAERIRPMAMSPLPGVPGSAPSASVPPGPGTPGAQTAAAWHTSRSAQKAGSSAQSYAWVLMAAVMTGVGVGAAGYFLHGRLGVKHVAAAGGATSAAPAPATSAAPQVVPPPAPAPAPSVSASAAASSAPTGSAAASATAPGAAPKLPVKGARR